MDVEEIIAREIENITATQEQEQARPAMRKIAGYVKRKSPFKKFVSVFFAEDLPTVKASLFDEVLVPTARDFVADIFIGGIERLLYGTSSPTKSRVVKRLNNVLEKPVTSYGAYYTGNRTKTQQITAESSASKERFTFKDVVMSDRAAAKELLDDLNQRITEYGNVSIAELYEAIEEEAFISSDFAENDYGWKELLPETILTRVSNGFWLNLPKPVQIR